MPFLRTPSIRGPKLTASVKKKPAGLSRVKATRKKGAGKALGKRVSTLAKAGPGKKFGKRISKLARRR